MIGMLAAMALAGSSPHTTGEIRIDLPAGRLEGAVCVENWPTGAGHSITLHRGLNLARVKDQAGKILDFDGWYGGAVDGEGLVYDFTPPPSGPVCFEYVGAAPMFPAHDAVEDFKGLIAADGKSLRAAEQAVWLPTPYDARTKSRLQSTTYKLHVACDTCRLLYVSGAPPVRGREGTFESSTPQRPLLFVGTGPMDVGSDVTFVNAKLSPDARAGWTSAYQAVRGFYAEYLDRPYGGMPTILRFDSVDKGLNPKRQWGFASWPTIAFGNGDLEAMGRVLPRNDDEGRGRTAYLAHEAAHYYFNGTLAGNGPYRWFLVESAAEFMSWKVLAATKGQAAMRARVASKVGEISWDVLPLNTIEREERIGANYRYVYGPLLLESLDRTIGDARMRLFMRGMLASPPTAWSDFTRLAKAAGVGEAEWGDWTRHCVDGAPKACIEALSAQAAP
ncbi:MAG: hypothetical protein KKC14_04270 [Alphaproteobacteria bacterium]|nr:hypothetical protein [Alphaproteobacteria bacterium]